MGKQAATVVVLLLFAALTFASVYYGGLRPSASTEHGLVQDLYTQLFFVAMAVFVLVEGLLLWFIYRFRERRNPDA